MGRQAQRTIITILVCALVVVFVGWWREGRADVSQICFLNVGQGDATVVRHAGVTVLIDAGSDEAVMQELMEVLPLHDRVIDLAVMTHPHADHIAGFEEVMRYYDITHALLTNVAYSSRTYERIRDTFMRGGHTIVDAPQVFDWEGLRLETLYPRQSFDGRSVQEVNNTSIVTLISFGELDFLLTADIEEPVEQELVQFVRDRSIEIMTVPHHGSNSSSSEAFIDAVRPQLAIIPVGPNTYGHPVRDIVERYHVRDIPTLRTDEEGTLCFALAGDEEGGLKRIK